MAARMLFEAAEAAGIDRDKLAAGIVDPGRFASARGRIDWETLVKVMDRLSVLVDGDPERMRAVGAHMIRAPSYDFLRRLAKGSVSVRSLYIAGGRWLAPALFPHLPLRIECEGDDRIRFEGWIPEAHAPSIPFFFIFQGCVRELPRLLGLPPATIAASEVMPRSVSLVLDLPASGRAPMRFRRSLRSLLGGRERLELLEQQRLELERGVEEMRRLSEELRRVLDSLPDPVCIQREGTLLWVNRMLAKTLGYDRADELVGRPVVSIVHESSVADVLERMQEPGSLHPELQEVRLLRRDGEVVIAEMSPTQLVVFGGVEARLVVGRDVTERVRMQERLVTADRLSSLGMLAAGVAHEINNPLAYVLGSIENARRSLEGPTVALGQAREALATALEGVARVRTIVRDLSALSRAEASSLQAVDVRTVLDSTLTLAGSEIEGRARIVREYEPVPETRVAPARLGQVFLNLMVNALEAMPGDRATPNELRVRTTTDPCGKPVVEVSDTGEGIPPEIVTRIFDPFFTTKPAGHGTGLGLAICHRIITEAGGEISVDSTPGKGSTFRLTLPPAE